MCRKVFRLMKRLSLTVPPLEIGIIEHSVYNCFFALLCIMEKGTAERAVIATHICIGHTADYVKR